MPVARPSGPADDAAQATASGDQGGPGYQRRVTDAASIRALAHPVRLALIEALGAAGPLTATSAGAMIGESPTTCSFHLRQLARYGYVEEAGGGKGRQRPWRLTQFQTRITPAEDDQEAGLAVAALRDLARQRAMDRLAAWDRDRERWPRRWRELSEENYDLLFVTADELERLKDDLHALLLQYQARDADPAARPAGAVAVEALAFIHPVGDPPGAADSKRTTPRRS
jgi:DNA-binding transcriptional ArsR family regulator